MADNNLQNATLPITVVLALVMAFGGWWVSAQEDSIDALEAEMDLLEEEIDELDDADDAMRLQAVEDINDIDRKVDRILLILEAQRDAD
jgi:uncharacterized protein YjcR